MKIAISTRVIIEKSYNEYRDALSWEWTDYLSKLDKNITTYIIPNNLEMAKRLMCEVSFDALILSNGNDIGSLPERDGVESYLLDESFKKNIKVLGVCRGHQYINYHFSKKMPNEVNDRTKHVAVEHVVNLEDSFAHFFEKNDLTVNSYHNFAIKREDLSEEFIPAAFSEDNELEAYYHRTKDCLCVLWHPERKNTSQVDTDKLILSFLKEGITWR